MRLGKGGCCLGLWMLACAVYADPVAQTPAGPKPAVKAKPATIASEARAAKSSKAAKPAPAMPADRCDPPAARPAPNLAPSISFRDCADTPEMVRLIGGSFMMGDTTGRGLGYEAPAREVRMGPFAIGKYEVTWEEWLDCVAARACENLDDEGWGRMLRPVINVSWEDAQNYLAWLSRKTGKKYRLPSEAEWEYVARARTQTLYSWGDAENSACEHGNVFDWSARKVHTNWFWFVGCNDDYVKTAPVGSFAANPWGIHDLQGNVWEWTQDCWHNSYVGAPTDGSAWTSGGDCGKRVNRGGGWGNNPRSMRPTGRDADPANSRGDAIGFRVAREME